MKSNLKTKHDMEEIKTRAEFFKELPLQKRLQAIEATRREGFSSFKSKMALPVRSCEALGGAFCWATSKQGGKYWVDVDSKYFKN